jgi:hypothetical protein
VAPSEERCADLHAPRGAALCLTRLRVWQKSRGRGGKSPALLVSSILNATRPERFQGQRRSEYVNRGPLVVRLMTRTWNDCRRNEKWRKTLSSARGDSYPLN